MRLVLLVWLGSEKCGGGGRDTGNVTATNWGGASIERGICRKICRVAPIPSFPPVPAKDEKNSRSQQEKMLGRKKIILRKIRAIVDVELKFFQPK